MPSGIQCNVCGKRSSRVVAVASPLMNLLKIMIISAVVSNPDKALLCLDCYNSYNEATRQWLLTQLPDSYHFGARNG